MKVTIYGTGYVGLVTGTCLAEIGHEVLCIDIDPEKIASLQQGIISIYEPNLAELVQKNVAAKRLSFSTDSVAGVAFSQIQMITVNTPTIENHGSDISNILAVAETIANHMHEPKLIINKSTAPPGTITRIKQTVTNINPGIEFAVASNPEFLKEGAAVNDFMQPDRIVVGVENTFAKSLISELYHYFNNKVIFMDIASAELSKYAANAMLATKISFMNEIAGIAEKIGADIEQVKHAMSLDPRIGSHFINPGCGYGGSCFPKDIKALAHYAIEFGIEPVLLNAVEQVNQRQKKIMAQKILAYFNYNIHDKTIAIWGLAFKPNTNDMREAPSVTLMKMLWQHGAKIQAYDPVATDEAKHLFEHEIAQGKLILMDSAFTALNNCAALAIVTEWAEFKTISLAALKEILPNAPIFDGRNLFDTAAMRQANIEYFSIGRG